MSRNKQEIRCGDLFGRWTVIDENYYIKNTHRNYLCRCNCENHTERYVDEYNLKRGLSVSCGCYSAENAKKLMTTHGMCRTRLYNIWNHMLGRCYNPNNKKYKDYGARGIIVCPEWKNDFEEFMKWADSTGFVEKSTYKECSIDRIDFNGNYEPSNCRWTDAKTQSQNRRTVIHIEYKGETHCIAEWARITGIGRLTLRNRYFSGLRGDELFTKTNRKTGNPLSERSQ